jgi:hypothetical protein
MMAMRQIRRHAMLLLCAAFCLTSMRAQEGGPAPQPLTALDYAEIEQLVARYAHALDTCAANGYDYADLFVTDGRFIVNGRVAASGREQLAAAAGGGALGCKNPNKRPNFKDFIHVHVNHVIIATRAGATGRVNLITIGKNGDPTHAVHEGGYQDEYVRTPQGWRFHSREHLLDRKAWHSAAIPKPEAK